MRILQINAVYNVGSTGVIVSDLHELSMLAGMDSYVAYSTSPLPKKRICNGYRIGKFFGKKVHAALCRINGAQGYFSRYSTSRFLKYIDSISPDIVHLHNLHSNYININMLLGYLAERKIKTVITLHDCWFFTGGCFYYTCADCSKWLNSCGDCPKRTADTPAYLYDSSARILSDRKKNFNPIENLTAVGVSKWISQEAEKSFLSKKNIFTIYNGIDTDFFVDTSSDFREKYGLTDKFVILGAANKWLKPVNRETLEFVTGSLPNDCVLALIGCTKRQKNSLPKNVLPVDYIHDRDELRKVYSMADVFANCTREDALSLINLEVQSCGTPVVTYRNTGVQETVDNKCGFSVETGNVRAFLDAIIGVKNVGKTTYKKQCRAWVVEKFNYRKNYTEYIDLYKSIMGEEE